MNRNFLKYSKTSGWKEVQTFQVIHIVRAEVDILDILGQLLQPRRYTKPAFFGDLAEKIIEAGFLVLFAQKIISSHHRELIEVRQ